MLSIAMVSLCGCTNLIKSSYVKDGASSTGNGWVYSLPKGQILLQASRRPITPQDYATATAAVATANAAVLKDETALTQAIQTQVDRLAKKPTPAQKVADAEAVERIKKVVEIDKLILEKSINYLQILQANGEGKGIETFNLSLQPVSPDRSARYMTNLNHSYFRDDTFKVAIKDGMLSTANTTTADRSVDAITSLAATGFSLAGFFGSGIPLIPKPEENIEVMPQTAQPKTFPLACTYELSMVFDPLNEEEVWQVSNALEKAHAKIRLEVSGVEAIKKLDENVKTKRILQGEINGLVYRVPTAVTVTVAATSNDEVWSTGKFKIGNEECWLQSKPVAQSLISQLPDTQNTYAITTEAGPFTTTTQDYTFTNGMLVTHNVSRPSEIMAPIAGIGKIAQGIMEIPATILKFRYDNTKSTDELVNAQTKLIKDRASNAAAAFDAQVSLQNAKVALDKLRFSDTQTSYEAQTELLKAQQELIKAQNELKKLQTPSTTDTSQ